MAVPDWPGTYGYNLFAYPLSTWLAGPWDLFIEHGHRLLGATAGLLAIALVVATFIADKRPWLRLAAVGALVLVIVQGALGGARVLFDERLVAMLHATVGPLFFAYLAGLVVCTSTFWTRTENCSSLVGSKLATAAWIAAGLAYVQLVLGAVLRHMPLMASPQVFRIALVFHLVVAAVLLVQLLQAARLAWRAGSQQRGLRLLGSLLPLFVLFQIALGAATYVAKYSWPAWMGDYQFAAAYVIEEKSLAQSLITTAHVATGSLILFVTVLLSARATRAFGAFHTRTNSLLAYSALNTRYSVLSTQYSVRGTCLHRRSLTSPAAPASHSADHSQGAA
jgi:cytochrome c oxidase assembly protein subunit 15